MSEGLHYTVDLDALRGSAVGKRLNKTATAMYEYETSRVDRALRLVLGLDIAPGPLNEAAKALAADAIERGLHVARHDQRASYGRPYVQIRDGSDVVLWDGWWTVDDRAYTWREEWSAARWRP
jgi:hypothetical protein